MIKKFLTSFVMVALIIMSTAILPLTAMAASVTTFSDTVSTLTAATLANHTISFVTPTGVASGATIILTFNNSTSIAAALDFTDVDVKDNGTNVTLAAAPSGATWGVVNTSTTVITLTNGTTAVIAGHTITILIGTNATNQSTGVRQITNGSAGTTTLALSGTFGDTGSVAMPIVSNGVVTVSATVNPTITFSLSSNTVALSTLTTGAANSGSHTAASSTNSPGGFAITYNGPTLTSGTNTIPVYTSSTSVPGTAGFGINLINNTTPSVGTVVTQTAGTCGVAAGYGTTNQFSFVASTATTVTAVTAPANCTYTVSYVANISALTPAGSYTTAIQYVDTGTF